jgi:hypothetical protein
MNRLWCRLYAALQPPDRRSNGDPFVALEVKTPHGGRFVVAQVPAIHKYHVPSSLILFPQLSIHLDVYVLATEIESLHYVAICPLELVFQFGDTGEVKAFRVEHRHKLCEINVTPERII